jgi:hypothetical protein
MAPKQAAEAVASGVKKNDQNPVKISIPFEITLKGLGDISGPDLRRKLMDEGWAFSRKGRK